MDKFCPKQTVHCDPKSECYSFTWSIHDLFSTVNLNFNSAPFKMLNGYTVHSVICISQDKFTCNITSTTGHLKCSVAIYIGSKTLLLSTNLQLPTRHSSTTANYHYDLVTLSSEDKCFQELKEHSFETLVFSFRIRYPNTSVGIKSVETSTNLKTDSLNYLKTIAAALKNSSEEMLKEKINLRVGQETEIVSKALLCARSPVFSKMFENDMKESNNNTVTISDIKMPVLKVIISYLYTGKLSNGDSELKSIYDFDFICELYYASDKYDIANLRQMCVDMLLPQVSKENVIRVMKLAFAHNDLVLKSYVIALISTNIDSWIFTDDWKNLVNDEPKIAVEILEFFDF